MITAQAGDEYSTSAPSAARILGRAKTCGIVTVANEPLVQAVAAAIMLLGAQPAAAIAEAIQYEQPGGKTLQEWADTLTVEVPKMKRDYSNLRAVRDAELSNAMGERSRSIARTVAI